MRRPLFALSTLTIVCLTLAACDGGDDDGAATADTGADTGAAEGDDAAATGAAEDSTGGAAGVDEDAVVAAAADYATFQRVTDAPYKSQHGLADAVHVWVPADLAAAYAAVADGTAPDYGPGALLVKEHLDAEGAHDGLTVMWKGPEGYAPESEDWWWGRIDAEGVLAEGGQVGYCVSCHAGATATQYVFGPPAG